MEQKKIYKMSSVVNEQFIPKSSELIKEVDFIKIPEYSLVLFRKVDCPPCIPAGAYFNQAVSRIKTAVISDTRGEFPYGKLIKFYYLDVANLKNRKLADAYDVKSTPTCIWKGKKEEECVFLIGREIENPQAITEIVLGKDFDEKMKGQNIKWMDNDDKSGENTEGLFFK